MGLRRSLCDPAVRPRCATPLCPGRVRLLLPVRVRGVCDGWVSSPTTPVISFRLDGAPVEVPADGASLLEALRDRLGVRSAKDGCSPQGQCGCCTVLVDGQARVACVTPVARVQGRDVTTVDGLDAEVRERWAGALCATGGSQCGFCTPGIVVRLAAHVAAGKSDDAAIDQALLAHLCRCTGWQTIHEAAAWVVSDAEIPVADPVRLAAAERRAAIEGRTAQRVHPDVAWGRGGFADDRAPIDALVAVRAADGEWVVADTLSDARRLSGKVQGRRTTAPVAWPIEVPAGEWARTLQTTWVDPAYLEPDAAWCVPGGEPVGPLENGGAFGGKVTSEVGAVARRLAEKHGRPVRALYAREDSVRLGPKRPPLAAGVRLDGSGVVLVVRTTGIADAIASVAPGLVVEEIDVPGPPTSIDARGAGWVEAAVLLASLRPEGPDEVVSPEGARATAYLDEAGEVHVSVSCGPVLDAAVLRSYCIGAAHMALGWVRNEGLVVDADGAVQDLTIRSFGVLRAVDTPRIHITIDEPGDATQASAADDTPDGADDSTPVNGSDAVFAAVAAAAWRAAGFPAAWPAQR
jgi:xanthine dehydrogenase small subunit